jgi:hypothetical protein
MPIKEVAPGGLPEGVRIVDTAETIAEINNKKVVKETAKKEASIEPAKIQIDVAAAVAQAVKAAMESQETRIAAMAQSKAIEIQKVKEEKDRERQEALEAKEREFQAMAENYEKSLTEFKEANANQVAQVQEALKAKEREVNEAKVAEQKLADVFKLQGYANPSKNAMKTPGFNKLLSSSRDQIEGTLAELEQIRHSSSITTKTTRGGGFIVVDNFVEVDRYVRANRSQIIKDLEIHAKKNGLLLGNGGLSGNIIKQAATQISDISGGFLPTLSSVVRTTHRAQFIFWQFAQTYFDYLKGHGSTIDVYRSAYFPSSVNPADWELSGGGSFYLLDTTAQQIQTGVVPVVLQEWGMGKPSTSNQVVSIPTFITMHSMIDIVSILEKNIGFNYAQFEDRQIRSLYSGTSVILYNNRNNIVTSPASIAASTATNSSGIITKEYLLQLQNYMYSQQFEPFPDGNFALALNPNARVQFKESLLSLERIVDAGAIEDISNILNPTVIPPESNGKVSGYIGTYYGFHIFVSNAFGVGTSGSEGVQTETINSTPTITRTSYAFGNMAVGRGIGTNMEIRQNEINNYGRVDTFTWISTEGFAALDVDPVGYGDTSAVPQQLRVVQIRTTDNPV